MRRGRPHPDDIRPGDTLDFWRVEEIRPPNFLRLRAEMRLPGRAWLQFEVEGEGEGSRILQTAIFDRPIGLEHQVAARILQGDGRIDPFAKPDALHSIANYLRGHGWREGMDRDGQHRIIFAYNNSTVYANTVLAMAEKIRGRSSIRH